MGGGGLDAPWGKVLDGDEPEADALAAFEAASLAASLKMRPAASRDGPKKKRLTAFLEVFSLRHREDARWLLSSII